MWCSAATHSSSVPRSFSICLISSRVSRVRSTRSPNSGETISFRDVVRKGDQLQFTDWVDFFLENYSRPPIRAEKTHQANQRVAKHPKDAFRSRMVGEITADDIELYLRRRLQTRVRIQSSGGIRQKDRLKPSTVHQELRLLRRMLNVAVRRRLLLANPCAGVEFPIKVVGMFRPHYMS